MNPEDNYVLRKNIEAIAGNDPGDIIAATKAALRSIDELEPKFAPFSPRQTVIYPSIDRMQCDLLRGMIAAMKEQFVAILAHYERAATEPPPKP